MASSHYSPLDPVLSKLKRATGHTPRPTSTGWITRCPAHEDRNPSLSIASGRDGRALLKCHAGCDFPSIIEAGDIATSDCFAGTDGRPRDSGHSPTANGKSYRSAEDAIASLDAVIRRRENGVRVATWDYSDVDGNVVAKVLRYNLPTDAGEKQRKTFRPISLHGDGWKSRDPKGKWPLFRLPTIAKAERVYIVEGEKCVDALNSIGVSATTSAHGANSPNKTDWSPLAGREVVLQPDNNTAGRAYSDKVAGILHGLSPPARVKMLNLPDLPPGGDIVDFLEQHDAVEPETLGERIESMADEAAVVEVEEDIPTTSATSVVLQSFASIEHEPLDWLWLNRIPLGMLSIFAGNPGTGKSLVIADIAARVSAGTQWPDGRPMNGPGDVILVNLEDHLSAVQQPRLRAAGANLDRIRRIESIREFVDGKSIQTPFNSLSQAAALREAIKQLERPRLVILDPLAAFFGQINPNAQNEIREAFAPFVEIAAEFGVAIILIHHLRQGTGTHTSERLAGSVQIGATVRQSWEVFQDPADENRRLFLPAKNSNGLQSTGLEFRIVDSDIPQSDQGDLVGRVEWGGSVEMSADQFARQFASAPDDDDPFPVQFLRDCLLEGPMPSLVRHALKQGRRGAANRSSRDAAFTD